MKAWSEKPGLALVLLIALGLRVWGLGFGLPGVAHDDEWYYCATAASCLERGTFKVETSPPYEPYMNPTGFTFLVALAELPVDAQLGGPGGEGTRARYRAHRGRYHLAGRWVSVIAGVLAVWATWLVGRTFLGSRAALLAAVLLALSPLHVRDAHFAVCDVTAGTFMIGALAAWRVRLDAKGAALAGVLLGLAAGTKYSAGLLFPALLLDVLAQPIPTPEEGTTVREERWRRVLLVVLGATAGFLLAFPAFLLDLTAFWRSFQYQAAFGKQPWAGQDPASSWWLHTLTLIRGVGPGALIFAALGWVSLLRSRRVALAVYPVLHLLVFLPMPLFFARLDVALLPFLCLSAAAGLGWLRGRTPWAAVVVALILPSALFSARIGAVMSQRETRLDLLDWLTERLPERGASPVAVALDVGAVRWLPLDATGSVHPGFYPIRLSALDGFATPEESAAETLVVLHERGVRYAVFTSAYSDPDPALRGLRELLTREAHLALEVHAGPNPVAVAQEERYGPWDHVWLRDRPGPSVWVFDLGKP